MKCLFISLSLLSKVIIAQEVNVETEVIQIKIRGFTEGIINEY